VRTAKDGRSYCVLKAKNSEIKAVESNSRSPKAMPQQSGLFEVLSATGLIHDRDASHVMRE
jgi:hypothetical protein